MSDESYLVEVLDIKQRRELGLRARRIKHRLQRGRVLRKKRLADDKRLTKRAERSALRFIRAKFAGKRGKDYKRLTPSSKIQVDRIIAGKKAPLKNIAKRLLPAIRKAERKRVSGNK